MKAILKISSILLVGTILFGFVTPEKKIVKLISKVWKNEDVSLKHVSIPKSLKKDVSQLNEVWSGDELIGYACYTSAFGCRIGGCAAPSNPNAQSFETFDYIVIYDTDLSILKVDIANYSGQYGYEICRAKWLNQFQGKTSGFVLNDNIDGISGATVSASYLIDDLNTVGNALGQFLKNQSI